MGTYKSIKLSNFGCNLKLFKVVNVIAWLGLLSCFTFLLCSSIFLSFGIYTSENKLIEWEKFPLTKTIIGQLNSTLNLIKPLVEFNGENIIFKFYVLCGLVLILTIYWMIYFFILIKRNSARKLEGVKRTIKVACYFCAVNRILFSFRYGFICAIQFLEEEKSSQSKPIEKHLIVILTGMSFIVIILDIIFASLAIHGLRKERKSLIKIFIIYTLPVFFLRLIIYITLLIISFKDQDNTVIFHVVSIFNHFFFFFFNYTFFIVYHSLVHESQSQKNTGISEEVELTQIEPVTEDYPNYARVGPDVSVRGQMPDNDERRARILSIHADMTGWLKIRDRRCYGIIWRKSLFLYDKADDDMPTDNHQLSHFKSEKMLNQTIRLRKGSEKLDIKILVDDQDKIDEKIKKWKKAIDNHTKVD